MAICAILKRRRLRQSAAIFKEDGHMLTSRSEFLNRF
jgi:hypothetical protein